MKKRWSFWALCFIGCIIVCVSFLLLSSGTIDKLILNHNRQDALREIEIASEVPYIDIDSLIDALDNPDWYVVAIATQKIGEIKDAGNLDSNKEDRVVSFLFKSLMRNGHWWRFGWDRDELEFQQFRAVSISVTAKFGISILQNIKKAVDGENPYEQETACWVMREMLQKDIVNSDILKDDGLYERISILATNKNTGVQAACSFVLKP